MSKQGNKKPFVPPFGSKLVLSNGDHEVTIEYTGEDSSITVTGEMNMVDFQAERLAALLTQAAKLIRGEGV